ncbi:hypothetical protein M1N05_00375, partial [Dehalococcoidales bacterium]|nr:hypothetical protein [Dehalococcoidales bacterium]
KVARVAAESSFERFDNVCSKIKTKFGLELSVDEIKDINEKMRMFLLSEESETYFRIPERLRRHVLEATKELGGT